MSVEKKAIKEEYIHWSKHPSYKGIVADLKETPLVDTKVANKFYRGGQDRALEFTMKLKYKQECEKRYGPDWKNFMKRNHLQN